MNRSHPRHGKPGPLGDKSRLLLSSRPFQRGFTLLEMIVVLVIMAILAGLAMPSFQSAFTEQAVRRDAHQLALMVKTAMIQSAEQHRTYVIDLDSTTMALHPAGETAVDPDAASSTGNETTSTTQTPMPDVDVTSTLDSPNQLLAPDPGKPDKWVAMPSNTQWVFEPGELCSATRVRLARGDAWVEMSFSALTGNVENETFSFP